MLMRSKSPVPVSDYKLFVFGMVNHHTLLIGIECVDDLSLMINSNSCFIYYYISLIKEGRLVLIF